MKSKQSIKKTKNFSYSIGILPKGCEFCVKGEKLVIFITGACNRNCFYCPLSEEKKNKDVFYANEWNADLKDSFSKKQIDIMLKEAELCDAKGAGITGGDPLLVIDRTVLVIKTLKKHFGKKFHIHLYSSLNNVTEERLKKLYSAGLDEIRFHPDFTDKRYWGAVKLVNKFNWDVGIEIPCIPKYEKETKQMIDYFSDKIKFLNLNELEISDTNIQHLTEKGYSPKNRLSYGVSGSEKLALNLMKYVLYKKYSFSVHFCTCKLKDAVQLAKRIKKRAENVAHSFDIITKEGTLKRGIIYLEQLVPSFSYRKILKEMNEVRRAEFVKALNMERMSLMSLLNTKQIVVDEDKLRLILPADLVKKNAVKIKAMGLIPAIVEEYPTKDAVEVEVDMI